MTQKKYNWIRTVLLMLGILAGVRPACAADGPPRAGLTVWLDAADAATLERGADGRLVRWRDKSSKGHDALNQEKKSNPATAAGAAGGKPVLRFNGTSDWLVIPGPLRAKQGPATVFIVSQRTAAQAESVAQAQAKRAGGKKGQSPGLPWQRLLGSTDGSKTPDNKPPNFCICATANGEASDYPLTAEDHEYGDTVLGTLFIGRAAGAWVGNLLAGDIAEILVYERQFLSEGDIRVVRDYLKEKWGARLAYEERGWTRIGALENPPRRTTDAFPLSDQANTGGWAKVEALSDEFEGGKLDTARWTPSLDYWKGRKPAWFNPENVSVSRGCMHLMMRRQPTPPALAKDGYSSYTSAAVRSNVKAHYGYYEIKARPMNSGGSSSFWFTRTGLPKQGTEIDVFEIGGKAPGFERKYNMNLHVFETPQEKRHWSIGGVWNAPWPLAGDFHVYGLDWGEDEIKYYVDGVIVRSVKNTNWKFPMDMIFDSETMPEWFGMPKDEDLPSTYSVDYVRAWTRRE